MARRKTGDKKAVDKKNRAASAEENIHHVQADDHSIAFEELHIGGDVGGDIRIGHTIGYTAEQVSVLLKQITTTLQPKKFDGRCPYKGLEVFEEEDAELFFGRERLVNELVGRVKESRTVFITGPSGSGKSSLVRAGLIHALKQGAIKGSDRWLYETMKPGREPLKDLALAFSRLKSPELEDYFLAHSSEIDILNKCAESVLSGRKDQRFILFIDQFEEVFTQINSEVERVAFINMLAHAGTVENGRVIVLFAMRSDFVSNCATYPALNELLSQEFRQIGAMQPEELVSAIALPAMHVGLPVEHQLIAQIINDMKGEPDALPLMQFALKDLFDAKQAEGGVIALTLADYLKHGGIHKSLERHADATFAKLSKSEQELTRSIFSGLIEIGRGTQDTKRTALFDELIPANTKPEDVLAIVQKLADARLIITDEQAGKDTVTISHEKLIEAWPWLKKLVNENRDAIALQNEIASDAKEWEDHQRDPSYVYTGARFANAREQLESRKLVLSGLAQEFIRAGVKAHTDELDAAARRVRRFVYVTLALLLALGAAVFFGLVARAQATLAIANETLARNNAQTAQAASTLAVERADEAQKQAHIARAGELAAQSTEMRDENFSLSLLLGIEAFRLLDNVESRGTLLDGASANPQLKQFITGQTADPLTNLDRLTNVAFSPNGRIIAIENRYTISILDMKTGQSNCQIPMSNYGVGGASAFTPDSKVLAAGTLSEVILWDVSSCQPIGHPFKGQFGSFDFITNLTFSPDGKILASDMSDAVDYKIILWNVETGQPIGQPLLGYWSVDFTPDGKTLVSGGSDGIVTLWDIETGQPIGLPLMEYENLALSPDGKTLASSTIDNTIILWDISTLQPIGKPLKGHIDNMQSMVFSSDGNILALVGWDNTILLWNVVTDQPMGEPLKGHQENIIGVTFNPDGESLESVSRDGAIILWNLEYRLLIGKISTEDVGQIFSVDFSHKDKTLVSGSGTGMIVIWNTQTLEPIGQSFTKNSESVEAVAFSPDGKIIASGSRDGSITFWDESTGLSIGHPYNNHTEEVSGVTFSLNGKILASTSHDTTILWDVDTHKIIGDLLGGDVVAFSPDGKILAIAGGSISLWDVATLQSVGQPLTGQYAFSVAFSPDGKILATGSGNPDGTIYLWNVATHQLIGQPLIGHSAPVASVAFSPNGKILATGGYDGVIILYDVDTRQPIGQPLTGHHSSISSISFSPDGKTLASGSWDSTIILWDIDSKSWVKQSCQRAGGNFTRAEWERYFPNEEYRKTCEQWPLEVEVIATPSPTP